MSWFTKKTEQPIDWQLNKQLNEVFCQPPRGHWEIMCSHCGEFYPTDLPAMAVMLHVQPAFCPACEFVRALPYSVQDRILSDLEYDMDS